MMRTQTKRTTEKLPLWSTDDSYLEQVVSYYHQQLMVHYPRLQHLVAVLPDDMRRQRWGYCDRTLGLHLSSADTSEGGAIRGALQRLGVLKPNGHEVFRGCIVVPIFDDNGMLLAIKGKRVAVRLPARCSRWIDWFRPMEAGGGYATTD
ncbi:hypothetical protein [Rheinheimera soli]|uniref:Uncharacterized protein n=1 Tax=Rheinheimera soli TaxID=443616 RepID=A0ABU1W557_9GAMM|nr:hypothetical protein [Rheinheimera soli]MDR7123095.1 hypothetical protein [Rheinheimera soli]